MAGDAIVIQGNALNLPIEDESVDLIITSPPYFALRSYRDGDEHYDGQIGSEPTPQEFLEALCKCTREMIRVLKPTGSIWVNLGDKYANSTGAPNNGAFGTTSTVGKSAATAAKQTYGRSNFNATGGIRNKSLMGLPWRYAIGCIDDLGLILRAEVVWSKPNGLPESVTDRVRRSHEQWFHFTKEPKYFAAMDEVREPQKDPHPARPAGFTVRRRSEGTNSWSGLDMQYDSPNPLGKLPGSVWTIPSEPLIVPEWARTKYNLPDHFAAFPQEWPRRIILGWSPSGVCVECGEGRRPVVDKQQVKSPVHGDGSIMGHRSGGPDERGWDGLPRFNMDRTITGYACACTHPNPDNLDFVYPVRYPETKPAVVLDPFGGTGTVAMVARALGRTGISVDLSHDYSRLAKWRIFESGHAGKTMGRTNKERQGELL